MPITADQVFQPTRRLAKIAIACAASFGSVVPLGSACQAQTVNDGERHSAIGIEAVASSDSSGSDVAKLAYASVLSYEGPEEYVGVTVEGAWFRPYGGDTRFARRAYLDIADNIGSWNWSARIGTDGDNILGSALIHNANWSRQIFLERQIVETPDGIDLGLYRTKLGTRFQFYLDDQNTVVLMAGVEEFTGKNEQFLMELGYTHDLAQGIGLNGQMNLGYYHSTTPYEFDYYSPKNRIEILPAIALTRYSDDWSYNLEAGYGLQRATDSGWEHLRYAHVWVESPDVTSGWKFNASLNYTNSSLVNGPDFDYVGGNVGLYRIF